MTLLGTRSWRIGILLLSWLSIREVSIRTDGFENGPIICPIRLLTGFPCPGCGGIRAIGAISVGQFNHAWSLNPLGFIAFAIAIFWAVRLSTVNSFLRALTVTFKSQTRAFQIIFIFLLYAAAWITTIARFNHGMF